MPSWKCAYVIFYFSAGLMFWGCQGQCQGVPRWTSSLSLHLNLHKTETMALLHMTHSLSLQKNFFLPGSGNCKCWACCQSQICHHSPSQICHHCNQILCGPESIAGSETTGYIEQCRVLKRWVLLIAMDCFVNLIYGMDCPPRTKCPSTWWLIDRRVHYSSLYTKQSCEVTLRLVLGLTPGALLKSHCLSEAAKPVETSQSCSVLWGQCSKRRMWCSR